MKYIIIAFLFFVFSTNIAPGEEQIESNIAAEASDIGRCNFQDLVGCNALVKFTMLSGPEKVAHLSCQITADMTKVRAVNLMIDTVCEGLKCHRDSVELANGPIKISEQRHVILPEGDNWLITVVLSPKTMTEILARRITGISAQRRNLFSCVCYDFKRGLEVPICFDTVVGLIGYDEDPLMYISPDIFLEHLTTRAFYLRLKTSHGIDRFKNCLWFSSHNGDTSGISFRHLQHILDLFTGFYDIKNSQITETKAFSYNAFAQVPANPFQPHIRKFSVCIHFKMPNGSTMDMTVHEFFGKEITKDNKTIEHELTPELIEEYVNQGLVEKVEIRAYEKVENGTRPKHIIFDCDLFSELTREQDSPEQNAARSIQLLLMLLDYIPVLEASLPDHWGARAVESEVVD